MQWHGSITQYSSLKPRHAKTWCDFSADAPSGVPLFCQVAKDLKPFVWRNEDHWLCIGGPQKRALWQADDCQSERMLTAFFDQATTAPGGIRDQIGRLQPWNIWWICPKMGWPKIQWSIIIIIYVYIKTYKNRGIRPINVYPNKKNISSEIHGLKFPWIP